MEISRRCLLALAASAGAARAASWDRRPFPDWDSSVTDKVLTDSPWAHPLTVPFEYAAPPAARLQSDFLQIGLPGGWGIPSPFPGSGRRSTPGAGGSIPQTGTSVRTEAYLTVRWASALPVRQAMALEQFGRQGLGRPDVRQALDAQPEDYVVEFCGWPAIAIPKGAEWLGEQLQQTARIAGKGRRPLAARSCRVPPHGTHLIAELRFPRDQAFQLEDGLVEVTASAAGLNVEHRFKLRPMVYNGRLEL